MGQVKGPIVCAKAWRSAALSHSPTGGYVTIPFDTNVFDTSGFHSTTVNPTRFTAPGHGKYIVAAGVRFAGSATGSYRAIQIAKNQVSMASCWTAPTSAPLSITASDIIDMSAGDYIELYGYQDSGGTLAYLTGQDATWLSIALLR